MRDEAKNSRRKKKAKQEKRLLNHSHRAWLLCPFQMKKSGPDIFYYMNVQMLMQLLNVTVEENMRDMGINP